MIWVNVLRPAPILPHVTHPGHPVATIDLGLRRLGQLFDSLDPSPFREGAGSVAHRYLVACARRTDGGGVLRILVHAPHEVQQDSAASGQPSPPLRPRSRTGHQHSAPFRHAHAFIHSIFHSTPAASQSERSDRVGVRATDQWPEPRPPPNAVLAQRHCSDWPATEAGDDGGEQELAQGEGRPCIRHLPVRCASRATNRSR